MKSAEHILENARQRAREMNLPYQGALLPTEAYQLLSTLPDVHLVDVRTKAELEWVGRIPGAVEIELRVFPGMQSNPDFLTQLSQQLGQSAPVMFICRSGARSNQAAIIASESGFANCFNVLEGFEGDQDEMHHRGTRSGWKVAGLPWAQS